MKPPVFFDIKPTVFYDFDDTMLDTRHLVAAYINLRYGTNISAEMYLSGNSLELAVNAALPPGKAVSRDRFYEDFDRLFLRSMKWHSKAVPVKDAEKYIPMISRKYNQWVVTARQDGCAPIFSKLCKKFFGNHISGAHFVWSRTGECQFEMNQSKRDFIASFPGNKVAFFDDNPEEVRKTGEVITTYLFDPNDHHHHETDIQHRVKSWEEIASILL